MWSRACVIDHQMGQLLVLIFVRAPRNGYQSDETKGAVWKNFLDATCTKKLTVKQILTCQTQGFYFALLKGSLPLAMEWRFSQIFRFLILRILTACIVFVVPLAFYSFLFLQEFLKQEILKEWADDFHQFPSSFRYMRFTAALFDHLTWWQPLSRTYLALEPHYKCSTIICYAVLEWVQFLCDLDSSQQGSRAPLAGDLVRSCKLPAQAHVGKNKLTTGSKILVLSLTEMSRKWLRWLVSMSDSWSFQTKQ